MNANKTLLPTTIFLISSTLSPQLTPFCLLALIFSSFIQNSAHRTSHARNVNDAAERMREREDFVVDDGESRAIGRGGGGGFHYCSSFFSSWAVFVFRAASPHRVFAARSSPRIPGGEVVVVAISGTTAGQGRSGAEGTVHARNGDAGEGDVRPRRAAIAREAPSRPRDAQAPTSKDANAGHFSDRVVATSLGGRERKGRTTHRSRAAPLDRWMDFLDRSVEFYAPW